MQAFILAAGKATRMYPDTVDKPKCLLDVAGRPALDHILGWLRGFGVTSAVMNLSHCYERVVEHFARAEPPIPVHLSLEIDEPLGTARGVRNALHLLEPEFLLVYGDIITDLNPIDLFSRQKWDANDVTLSSYYPPNPRDCGVLVPGDSPFRVAGIVEKPPPDVPLPSGWAFSGVAVCRRDVFEGVPMDRPTDIARDLLPGLIAAGRRVGHSPIRDCDFLYDIGTPANYRVCCEHLEG